MSDIDTRVLFLTHIPSETPYNEPYYAWIDYIA